MVMAGQCFKLRMVELCNVGMAVDSAGNLWIADTANNAVRVVSSDGRLSTYFGGPSNGGWADGPIATAKIWYACTY